MSHPEPAGPAHGFLQSGSLFVISQRADAKLAEVEGLIQELNELSSAVADYFCEDPATFKLDECCSIFHSFCKRFDAAVQVINIHLLLSLVCWVFFKKNNVMTHPLVGEPGARGSRAETQAHR